MTFRKDPRNVTGCAKRGNKIQIQINLDPDAFEDVRNGAIKNKVSFAEQCRTLIEFGLETERTA